MELTINEQKKIAVDCLKKLQIEKRFIDNFEYNGKITFFKDYFGYEMDEQHYSELLGKAKEIEKEKNCVVYAVIEDSYFYTYKTYSFLMTSKYEQDTPNLVMICGEDKYRVEAYVWNTTKEEYSENGYVIVENYYGGIARTN